MREPWLGLKVTKVVRGEGSVAPRQRLTIRNAWLTGSAAGALVIIAWSLASPIGSVPDSAFHLSSIWCAASAPDSGCPVEEAIPGQPRARLPAELIYPSCFTRLPNGSPSCLAGLSSTGSASAVPNQLQELNPNGFYFALGFLAGDHFESRVLLMRIVSGISSAAIIGVSALLLQVNERKRFLFLALTMHIPLGLVFASSVNPSGVSIALVVAAVPLGLQMHRAHSPGEATILIIHAGLLLLMAAGVRRDTMTFVGLVLLAMTASRIGRSLIVSRRQIVVVGTLTVATGAIVAQLFSSTTGDILLALRGGLFADSGKEITSGLFFDNMIGTILLWFAAVGGWSPASVSGLGFAEVTVPSIIPLLVTVIVFRTIFRGRSKSSSIPPSASASILALAWVIPFLVLTAAGLRVGQELQPRYILPLLAAGVAAAGLADPRLQDRYRRRDWFDCGAVIVAHSLGLGAIIAHYSFNKPLSLGLVASVPAWRWSAIHPTLNWLVGSAAFAVLVYCLSVPGQVETQKSNLSASNRAVSRT